MFCHDNRCECDSPKCCDCESPEDCKEKKCANDKTFCRKKAEAALNRAHEIRKFEIGMLWNRAKYVATFQTILFAALGVSFSADAPVQNGLAETPESTVDVLRLVICVVGVYSSFFWCLINKGSKFWHENWERHIDFLEYEFEGNLHKTVLHKYGMQPYSVSRVNISISQMFFAAWFVLLIIIASNSLNFIKCYCNMFFVPDDRCIFALMAIIAISLFVFRQKLKTNFTNRCERGNIHKIDRGLPRETVDSLLQDGTICDEITRCWSKITQPWSRFIRGFSKTIQCALRKLCGSSCKPRSNDANHTSA